MYALLLTNTDDRMLVIDVAYCTLIKKHDSFIKFEILLIAFFCVYTLINHNKGTLFCIFFLDNCIYNLYNR